MMMVAASVVALSSTRGHKQRQQESLTTRARAPRARGRAAAERHTENDKPSPCPSCRRVNCRYLHTCRTWYHVGRAASSCGRLGLDLPSSEPVASATSATTAVTVTAADASLAAHITRPTTHTTCATFTASAPPAAASSVLLQRLWKWRFSFWHAVQHVRAHNIQ